MKTRLSIVIPTFNEAPRIGPLIRFLSTNGGDTLLDLIVVDGGSTDDTVQEARNAGATVLLSPVRGRAPQLNHGARAAQGDILYFVHADTLPPASFATDILHALSEGHEMGGYRYQFDSPRFILKLNAYFMRFPWLVCQGGDKTFFIRKSVFLELGGYDEFYTIMEEYDFARRALKKYHIHTIPKNAIVSARKYEHNSWLRVQVANFLVFNMFKWGFPPERLKRLYKKLLVS